MSEKPASGDLDELRKTAKRIDRAWATVAESGGLWTLTDAAEVWGVELATVRSYREKRQDFPDPVATIGRSDVWTAAALSLWRATPRQTGRPRKHPE